MARQPVASWESLDQHKADTKMLETFRMIKVQILSKFLVLMQLQYSPEVMDICYLKVASMTAPPPHVKAPAPLAQNQETAQDWVQSQLFEIEESTTERG